MLGLIAFVFPLLVCDGRVAVADDTQRATRAFEWQRATRAFNWRDYTTAGVLFLKLAREGELDAYPLLSQFYRLGTGRPQDLYEALYWARNSGDYGRRDAERILDQGISLPASDQEVAALYLRQAAQGDVAGSYRAALVSETGRGVEQDDAKAFEFYLRAAQAGHPYAQYEVADRYFAGRGVAQDPVTAAEWMKKASEQGLTIAKYAQADFLLTGVGTIANPAAAMALYKSAAEDGYARSQVIYASMLFPKAESRDERIESLKWLMLGLPLLEPRLAITAREALNSAVNRLRDRAELEEAQARAKAFIRSRQ